MKIRRHPLVENRGHVLLASLMLVIMLSLLSMTALYLVGQDGPGISAMRARPGPAIG
jgi:Tfp pilus assembly protein PilX